MCEIMRSTDHLPPHHGISNNKEQQIHIRSLQLLLASSRAICCDNSTSTTRHKTKSLLRIARYCDRRLLDDDDVSDDVTREVYAVEMTRSVLEAMRLGEHEKSRGGESLMRVARLLSLIRSSSVARTFARRSALVPSWKFMGWIGHLVAMLDDPEGHVRDAVGGVVSRLAGDYPQAVVYPVKVAMTSCESREASKYRWLVRGVDKQISNLLPHVDQFIKQLNNISNPYVRFQDWVESHRKLLRSGKCELGRIMRSYQHMYLALFAFYREGEEAAVAKEVGSVRCKFARRYKNKMDEVMGGEVGSKVACITDEHAFITAVRHVLRHPATSSPTSSCEGDEKRVYRGSKLSDYSPWLANSHRQLAHLEVPGQYGGGGKPDVTRHVTVTSLGEEVEVMESLREPLRIRVRGSRLTSHEFLVKCGDDLRQDERCQQIFASLNHLLSVTSSTTASSSRHHDHVIGTYRVVAMSASMGVIGWLPGTRTLHQLISKQAKLANCEEKLKEARRCYLPDEHQARYRGDNIIKLYGEWARVGDDDKLNSARRFTSITRRIPTDLLSESMMRRSDDAQSYVTKRKRFVTSYGVMCVAGWLLGVGDRHLNNILINLTSGAAVNIDLGHVFGSATHQLPVPELTPFRLSAQLLGWMEPYGSGWVREVMVRCMRVFASHKHHLISLFDIFLHDPSVQWDSRNAGKLRAMEEGSSSSVGGAEEPDRKWYARRKVAVVRRKLMGANPAAVTRDEIEQNLMLRGKYDKFYASLVRGSTGNLRYELPDDKLTPEQQVDCLIEQATDPLLLSRAYIGWTSWI